MKRSLFHKYHSICQYLFWHIILFFLNILDKLMILWSGWLFHIRDIWSWLVSSIWFYLLLIRPDLECIIQNAPLFNHDTCRELHNRKVRAIVREDKACLRKLDGSARKSKQSGFLPQPFGVDNTATKMRDICGEAILYVGEEDREDKKEMIENAEKEDRKKERERIDSKDWFR